MSMLKHYQVWIAGGDSKNGKRIAAKDSLEARKICAAAWNRNVADLCARCVAYLPANPSEDQ
jgi:hypothetical protein